MAMPHTHKVEAEDYLAVAATRRESLETGLKAGAHPQDVRVLAAVEDIKLDLRFALVHAILATVK